MRALAATFFLSLTAASFSETTPIFNGKNLDGWCGDTKFWSVKDGTITGQTSPENKVEQNSFLIWEGGTPADFTLTFKYKLTPIHGKKYGNSGVQYRSRIIDKANFIVSGYQADIEYGKNYSGILYEERGRGILAKRGKIVEISQGETPAKPNLNITDGPFTSETVQENITPDDWNHYTIIAKGQQVTHIINGKQAIQVTDKTAEAPKHGVIALQIHKGPPMKIQFKDLILATSEKAIKATEP